MNMYLISNNTTKFFKIIQVKTIQYVFSVFSS